MLFAAVACVDDATQQSDLCQQAAAHLAGCAGYQVPASDSCDVQAAQRTLETTCETLNQSLDNPKADGAGPLAQFACRLGIYSACEPVTCDEAPDAPAPDQCADWAQYPGCAACNYYRCREETAKCGEDAYLVGYVGKYCHRFATVTEVKVSQAAAQWLGRVRTCLISTLEADAPEGTDCQTIEQVGIASHSTCYVQSGFCDLTLLDWMSIVHSIDVGDVPLRSVLSTAHGCLREWFTP